VRPLITRGIPAAIALANKIERMALAIIVRGERFKGPKLLPAALIAQRSTLGRTLGQRLLILQASTLIE
jgi:hypothetical protein